MPHCWWWDRAKVEEGVEYQGTLERDESGGGTAFRLSEKYSYAYVFIRIRAYVKIIRCFPEPQKKFRK